MASLLLRPMLRPHALGLGVGLGLGLTTLHSLRQPVMRLDAFSTDSYSRTARTPVIKEGKLNPRAVRQISSGSIIGLCAGLGVSTFSKTLAVFIGLLVVVVQVAARYGINVVPYKKIEKYFTSVDLRSAVQDNMAFKISFGTTFAMAAFMSF